MRIRSLAAVVCALGLAGGANQAMAQTYVLPAPTVVPAPAVVAPLPASAVSPVVVPTLPTVAPTIVSAPVTVTSGYRGAYSTYSISPYAIPPAVTTYRAAYGSTVVPAAAYAPAPVVAYRPAYPVAMAPVMAPPVIAAPVVVGRPAIVSPKVYYPGQPVRNVLRAVTP